MIVTWSSAADSAGMDESLLVATSDLVRRHPWWRARAALVLELLARLGVRPPARVLDAGCGWGVTLEALEAAGYRCVGLDASRAALEQVDRPGRSLVEADLTGAWPDPPAIAPFDAVLALDVIEHLDDDRAAVRRLDGLLKPGGRLVLSVPALPELFGEFDAIQGHRRRYDPGMLRSACALDGLWLEEIFWWGSWMVPLLRRRRRRPLGRPGESAAAIYRRHLALPPWPLRQLMRGLDATERPRALGGRLRRGTSLFAVATHSPCDVASSGNGTSVTARHASRGAVTSTATTPAARGSTIT
jgi:SAM-dependent methyltransferase